MTTTFSSNPYFDDFNEDKKFHRILFRPGRAVQARELTQLQTISQNQIEKFGNHVFKNGSIVSECPFSIDLKTDFVKIQDVDILGAAVDMDNYAEGFTLTGLTSGVSAYVLLTADGLQTVANTKTFFIKYTSANGTTKTFSAGEQIEVRNTTGTVISTVLALASSPTGLGSTFNLGDGIIYANGVFITHTTQRVILERYSQLPSKKIGLTLSETIVNSDTDESLLDPALGSSNYFAIGADRYKIDTVLVAKNLTDDDVEDFFLLFEVENGNIKSKFDKPQYDELFETIAARTSEESGDYTVKPFNIRVREHLRTNTNGGLFFANTNPLFFGDFAGNVNLLAVGVEPGIAYVKGYRVEKFSTTYLQVEKGIDVNLIEDQPVSFNYGNFVICNELAGPWDVDNGVIVSLRDTAADAVTNQTYGSTSAPGSQIGTARVKSVLYETGNIGLSAGEYRLYLYDVNLTANVPFANVRSVYFNASSGPDSFADIVLTSNSAVLTDTNFNKGVFLFPQTAIKTLRDSVGALENSFTFKKTFNVTIQTNGNFTLTSATAGETFPFGAGQLSTDQKRNSFVLVTTQSGTTANLIGTANVSSASTTVNGTGTQFTVQVKAGDRLQTTGGNTMVVANVISNTVLNFTTVATGTEDNIQLAKVIASGEYVDLSETGSQGALRTANVTSSTTVDIDLSENFTSTIDAKLLADVQRTDGQEIKKILRQNRFVRIDCSSAGTLGEYNLGFSDVYRITGIFVGTTYSESNLNVTEEFILDNGQRDIIYNHAKIIKKPSSTLALSASSRILVKLDYFFHDTTTGRGFLSVDSYPVDDTTDTFRTENIPVYTSTTTGESFDLRNSIDIRPIITNTSADATSIGAASINPSTSTTLSVPSGGLKVPAPTTNFQSDLEFYLSRRDLIYVDKDNNFNVISGVSAIKPARPSDPPDGMVVSSLFIPPYPSLSAQSARNSGRFDYQAIATLVDNRGYTMRDIGTINQKLKTLEYYTALNLLEKGAADLLIPDPDTGLDRFKNGFLVDNFRGHGIGNTRDINYKVAVDPRAGELRPYFNIDNIDFEFNSGSSTNVVRAPRDAKITFTSNTGSFSRGEVVTQGAVTANVDYVVGTILYVSGTTGTFSANASITSSNASATVSNVIIPTDGSLVTLPYSHSLFASNPFATKARNCVGELLFTWTGEIDLDPPADNWTDTQTNPDVVVNFDNNLDNWNNLAEAWGTQWNDWQTNWSGTTTQRTTERVTGGTFDITTTTTESRQARDGTQASVVPETVDYSLGNRVVDVSIVPFIRSQIVNFTARRLKPNTRVFAFFDSEKVSEFCRPVGGNFGDALVTNSVGSISGQFFIPNSDSLRFRVGQRDFRLSDDVDNRVTFTTTVASEQFNAFGINQTNETTILSTRQPRVSFNTIAENRTLIETATVRDFFADPQVFFIQVGGGGGGDGGGDPIAQTFIIENNPYGLFLSKLELFFRTKSSTLPITLQIREVLNGFPTEKVLPFGSVTLDASEINVSEDASAPTIFTFPSPVYLQPGVEYCFVLLPAGNNPDYNIWVSQLGENQLGTTNRVSEQPYIGLLFTSANNRTWTPVQSEDIKFNLYQANFVTGTTGTIVLQNDDSDYLNINNLSNLFRAGDSVTFSEGSGTVKSYDTINDQLIVLKSGNFVVRGNITGTGNVTANTSSNVITGGGSLFNTEAYANAVIYSANTGTRLGKIQSITSDTAIILTSNAAENVTGNAYVIYDEAVNTTNANIRATVNFVNSKLVNLFDTNLSLLTFPVTTENSTFRIRNASTNTLTSDSRYLINENTETVAESAIRSNSTENVSLSNVKSFISTTLITSTDSSVSPVLDLFKTSSVIVHNQVNNDSTNETTNSGNALSRYISKQVILDEGQDAEDLRVYVTGYKPAGTNIEVYAKILNATDGTPFSEANYIKLEQVTSTLVNSSSLDPLDFKEFEFKIPSASLTGPNGEVQYTASDGNTYTGYKYFAIKIVLLSNNTSLVPRAKDYRAIALQI